MPDEDHINRQLFELLVLQIGLVDDLVMQVAVLRKLFEQQGVSDAVFEQRLAEARAQVGHQPSAVLARVQRLVAALHLDRQ